MNVMKMGTYKLKRKPNGQFDVTEKRAEKKLTKQKGSFMNKLVITIAIIGVLLIGGAQIWNLQQTEYKEAGVEKKETGLTPEQEAQLAKESELSRKEMILLNEKTKIEAQYKADSERIETELETIRAERLNLI